MQPLESLNRFSPYVLAVLRIVTALIFMTHGMQKLFGFPEPPQGGLPPVLSLFWIGGIMELGGVLILIGLFTRIIAFVLCSFSSWSPGRGLGASTACWRAGARHA